MTIKQTIQFDSPAASIYDILVTSELFAKASGAPAEIDAVQDGAVSLFGGYVLGSMLEMVPNQRVVQRWRSKDWPEGVESKVHFELKESNGKTTLEFEHSGFPVDAKEHLEEGWHNKYWNPIKEFLK